MAEDTRLGPSDVMSQRELDGLLARLLVLAIAWNLLGNLVFPGWSYVPVNLGVIVLALVLARRRGLTWPELGFDRSHVWRGLVIGLIAVALIGAVVLLAGFVPFFDDIFEAADSSDVDSDSIPQRFFTSLIRIPIGTALAEEVFFRSVALTALIARLGMRWGVFASSVAFGLWHIAPAVEGASGGVWSVVGSTVGVVLFTTLAGLIFAGLRFWGRHVVAPILTHSATNTFAYLAAIISASD